ncbi:MAG: helix-turn-helix domain-containing protein [Deltaproteobacteria bacterium]|nr:helix-turn-helix domain-containing protein [Deltaproteobacteria bacterium]
MQLLTYRRLSELTGIPIGTLKSWVHHGRIPHVRLGPRCVRFRAEDIEAWLAAGYRPATGTTTITAPITAPDGDDT